MTAKIEKLTLTIGKKKLSLTLSEARDLYNVLAELFKKETLKDNSFNEMLSKQFHQPSLNESPKVTYHDRRIQEQTKSFPGLVDPIIGPTCSDWTTDNLGTILNGKVTSDGKSTDIITSVKYS